MNHPMGRPPFPPPPGFNPGDDFTIPEADVSFVKRKWLDIPYATISPAEKLDIYLPEEGEGPFPVILNIHGGAFAIGDKRDTQFLPFLMGLERGYAVVGVNYRLSGEAIFPAGLQDVKAAVRWIRTNAQNYRLDGKRIAAVGGSAGGWYTSMLALTDSVKKFDDPTLGNANVPCNVQAAVVWYGPTDYLKMDEQLDESGFGPGGHNDVDSPESRFLGQKITEIPDKVKEANPITYIHENMPPMLIQHGRLDHVVPVQQSIIFVQTMVKYIRHDCYDFDILEKAEHGDPLFETKENFNRVLSFLDSHLK